MVRKKDEPKRVELTPEEMAALQERITNRQLRDEDYALLSQTLLFVTWLQSKLMHARISLTKLRRLFGLSSSTERQARIAAEKAANEESDDNGGDDDGVAADASAGTANGAGKQKNGSRNNGRNPSSAYHKKTVVNVSQADHKAGDDCPLGCGGRLYTAKPGVIIKVVGQNNFCVMEYRLEKLRCALCGELFSADAPAAALGDKYDAKFKASLALQKYYNATPFYTLERYHKMLGLSLPDATQWTLVEAVASSITPIYDKLCDDIAQGTLLYYDDTWLRILSVIAEGKKDIQKKRGCYTTGFVGHYQDHPIRLFMSGDTHAGINLAAILKHRHKDLPQIQTMSDALAANVSHGLRVVICHCFAHALRQFKDIAIYYERECDKILKALDQVYKNEDIINANKLNDDERLSYHQKHSLPTLEELQVWLNEQKDKHLIEPNSHLGKAVNYLLKHWAELLQFTKVAGAPIDNNICEQLLKLAIRIRKTSYFHKSVHGAQVSAKLMSVIYTCLCHNINPVDYLTACQENEDEVRASPGCWLPWNYHEPLTRHKKAA